MRIKPFGLLGAGALLLVFSLSLFAHHGSSAYESKLTTLKGTVTQFQFMNPHTEILFEIKDDSGKTQKWSAEAASLLSMTRLGWNKNSFLPGDQDTFIGNKAKNGSYSMRLSKVIFANGKQTVIDRGEDYASQ
jgi:hypothetical protein